MENIIPHEYPLNIGTKAVGLLPLDEENILKLGFSKIEGISYEGYRYKVENAPFTDFMIFKIDNHWHYGFNEVQTHCFSHFQYVYQLQFLFYLLTDKELLFNHCPLPPQ